MRIKNDFKIVHTHTRIIIILSVYLTRHNYLFNRFDILTIVQVVTGDICTAVVRSFRIVVFDKRSGAARRLFVVPHISNIVNNRVILYYKQMFV